VTVPTSHIVSERGAEMDWPVTVSSSHDSGFDSLQCRVVILIECIEPWANPKAVCFALARFGPSLGRLAGPERKQISLLPNGKAPRAAQRPAVQTIDSS
jgi:hypothetical protein